MRFTLSVLIAVLSISVLGIAQTGTFTYQGKLTDGTNAANGTYEMQFSVHTAASGGTQIGSTITNNAVSVVNGVFTVNLNFSPAEPFSNGADRFLEIAVRKASDPPGFTTLSPRQQITSSPYSIRTLSASTSDSLSSACVGCVDDAKISGVAGSKVAGPVAQAANVTSVVPIVNGGTGSATKNFVDLTTNQTIAGNKTFTGNTVVEAADASTYVLWARNTAPSAASNGSGLVGTTAQAGTIAGGVRGENSNTNGTGIFAMGNGQGGVSMPGGSGLSAVGFTTAVFARTNNASAGQALYTDNFGDITRVNYYNGTLFKINGEGTVSTLVRDEDQRKRVMFAPEAPEVLLEDYGVGRLINGRVHIDIDAVFARNITVNDRHPLRVFIQLEGDCNGVYVTNKTPSGFDVVELGQGRSNVSFSWHIVGNRADEDLSRGRKDAQGRPIVRMSRYADLRFPVQDDDVVINQETSKDKKP
jgi:hypothetical protein